MSLKNFFGQQGDIYKLSRCWTERPDPEMFFDELRTEEAREYCDFCLVKVQCKQLAKELDADGIWGATSRKQRRHQDSRTNRYLQELEARMNSLLRDANDPNAA